MTLSAFIGVVNSITFYQKLTLPGWIVFALPKILGVSLKANIQH